MTLVLISFCSFFFTQHVITRISSRVQLRCTMFYQIYDLPEDELKSFARNVAQQNKYSGLVEKLIKAVLSYSWFIFKRFNSDTMLPSNKIAIAPFQFLYRIDLLPLEQIFFGMIIVTESGWTAPIWKWYEAYRIAIDPLQKPNGTISGTEIGYDF